MVFVMCEGLLPLSSYMMPPVIPGGRDGSLLQELIYRCTQGESTSSFADSLPVHYLNGMPPLDPAEFLIVLKQTLSFPARRMTAPEGFRKAAVLVPLIVTPEGTDLLLTRRTEAVETHKGQISFPGGVADEKDADPVQTALREAHEELGISPLQVEVMGVLDDLMTPTGFVITPVVGLLRGVPPLIPNPMEVDEAFTVPLDFFRDPAHGRTEWREVLGEPREIWFYEWGNHTVWGATALIIRSLLARITAES